MPDRPPCEVTLFTYMGDPEQVQMTGEIHLPNGHIMTAPVNSPISFWRQVMYPKGNASVVRHACTAMQDQMREKGIIPK